jgi:hypothetical protein
LMVLDGVLAEPEATWLGLALDKVATFTAWPSCVSPDRLPRTTVGGEEELEAVQTQLRDEAWGMASTADEMTYYHLDALALRHA